MLPGRSNGQVGQVGQVSISSLCGVSLNTRSVAKNWVHVILAMKETFESARLLQNQTMHE
jgi:hypothetical protein